MKLRKSVKLIVVAFGLVGLPAGAWWAWDAVNESRFRDALSRYREMGLPESVRDLQRALPAAEENAAFHYMAAIDKANELERIDPRSFTGSLHTLPLTSGEGVTWNCAVDDEISNQRPNCDPTWNGGDFGTASAAPVFGPHRAVRSKFGQSRE